MLKTSARGRRYFSGARWQLRHHSICRLLAAYIRGMRSTGPWQVAQPTPLLTWMLWSKYTKSGSALTRVHSSDLPERKLSRTGSSNAALVQIWAWQFMHVLVGGMPAKLETSTEVWQ